MNCGMNSVSVNLYKWNKSDWISLRRNIPSLSFFLYLHLHLSLTLFLSFSLSLTHAYPPYLLHPTNALNLAASRKISAHRHYEDFISAIRMSVEYIIVVLVVAKRTIFLFGKRKSKAYFQEPSDNVKHGRYYQFNNWIRYLLNHFAHVLISWRPHCGPMTKAPKLKMWKTFKLILFAYLIKLSSVLHTLLLLCKYHWKWFCHGCIWFLILFNFIQILPDFVCIKAFVILSGTV